MAVQKNAFSPDRQHAWGAVVPRPQAGSGLLHSTELANHGEY